MNPLDGILFIGWLCLLYCLLLIIREWRYPHQSCAKYLLPAFTFKVVGVLCFDAIYVFYYHGGDTLAYHEYSVALYRAIIYEPALGLKVLLGPANHFEALTDHITRNLGGYFFATNTFTVVKIATIFNFLTFGQFWTNSLLFAALGFAGLWAMFRVFVRLYPYLERPLAWAALFIPSVAFWGSGILKDTISLSALGMMLYLLYKALIVRQQIILSLLAFPFCFYAVSSTKSYIIVAFLPAFLIWALLYYKNKLQEQRLKIAILIVVLCVLAVVYQQTQNMIAAWGNVLFVEFVKMAMSFHSWHGISEQTGGAAYSLGEIEFTVGGIFAKFPQSVTVTLFRPYLYEVHSPVMLMTAIESIFTLLFTLYVLFKTRIFRLFSCLSAHPFAYFSLIFSLLFAFAVGFTSYNFGALARYKIPCMPFYFAALIIILGEQNQRNLLTNNTSKMSDN